MVTVRRKAEIRVLALRYLADHMRSALDADPGPHEIAVSDEEDAYLVDFVKKESAKLINRAYSRYVCIRCGRPSHGDYRFCEEPDPIVHGPTGTPGSIRDQGDRDAAAEPALPARRSS